MIRGTTPDYILTLADVDLTGQTVYVTIAQNSKKLTLTGNRLNITVNASGSEIAFSLTQQDTLGLSVGDATIQARFIDQVGNARATEIVTIDVKKVLLEKVIAYAENPG